MKTRRMILTLLLCAATLLSVSAQVVYPPKWSSSLQARADRGNAEAQYRVGMCYITTGGRGNAIDEEKGFRWFRKAALQGYPKAEYMLWAYYSNADYDPEIDFGMAVPTDEAEAEKWLARAIKHGNGDAMMVRADNAGTAEEKNTWKQKAIAALSKAGNAGDVDAQLSLAKHYEPRGDDHNIKEAIRWYRKAAVKGNIEAQNNLGVIYSRGDEVDVNYMEAVKWYTMAAERGNCEAQMTLGLMYASGEEIGRNDAEAVRWLSKVGLNMGPEDIPPVPMYGWARHYYNGDENFEKRPAIARGLLEKVVEWYRTPKGQKDIKRNPDLKSVMSDALRMLQALHRFGRGTAVNVPKANKLLREAARYGDPDAAAIARLLNE